MTSPWGDIMWIPTPAPCFEEALSTFSVQIPFSDFVLGLSCGSSLRKSARTCDFAQVLTQYSRSYSLSSTAHLVSLPDSLAVKESSQWLSCQYDDPV